jgi:hypothetical protein
MSNENIITAKIKTFHRRKTELLLISGLLHFFVFLSVIWISTFVADSVLYFSRGLRWFVLFVNFILTIILFYHLIGRYIGDLLKPRRKNHSLTMAAREIGFLMPDISDRLLNAYQIQSTDEEFSSPELRNLAVSRFYGTIERADFRTLLNLKQFLLPLGRLFYILAGGIVISVLLGDHLLVSAKRIFNPAGEYHPISSYHFEVLPGDTTVIAGKPVTVRVKLTGPEAEDYQIDIYETKSGNSHHLNLERKGSVYNATITGIRSDFNYQISAIPVWEISREMLLKSEIYKVGVIIPPTVNDLQISIKPPAYTGLEVVLPEPNTGDILAYRGSEVDLTARLNKSVRTAVLNFSSGVQIPAVVRGETISARFKVTGSENYRLQLIDEQNVENEDPIRYQIKVMEDIPPVITVLEPGRDIDLAPDAELDLLFEARDDFGFSRLWLAYQIVSNSEYTKDTTWQQIPLDLPSGRHDFFRQQYLWEFANTAVGFGDALKYYLAIQDNDRITGPKTGFSGTYRINFPTIEQIFSATDREQKESIDQNKTISEESEQLHEELEKISREMKRDKEVDWERRKQIETAMNKQEDIQKKLDKIQENLDDAIRKLEQSRMISPEILEKYQQLQQLFQEIATPELKQSMKALQEALEKLDQDQTREAMEDFKKNQEKFAEDLERTLELFQKVQFEQEMDRLAKMAEKAVKDQEKITRDLTDGKNEAEQLKQQERQEELMSAMRKNLEKLMQNDQLPQYPEAEKRMQEAASELNSGQLEKLSTELKNQMQSGQKNDAVMKSQDLADRLQQLQDQISGAKENILATNKQNISEQLRRSTANLLQLSQQQEELINRTADAGSLSDQFRDLAGEQQQIATKMSRVIGDMVQLSRETFMLSPDIGQAMANAGQGMRKSLSELENRNKTGAGNAQKQAMGALNQAAMAMQSTMEGMAGSGSALGFEEFMKKMQQMAGQQGQLNQDAMGFLQGQGSNPGLLSQEAQQNLRRMAGEQRALQQSMDELNNQMGKRSDVLGNLDNIAREMENVAGDMEKMQLDRKTIERQRKILSRMLDAQKSMREQEYSRQRQAEVGKEYARRTPDERQKREDLELKRLQDELMRALQEGYNPDYEKVIEAYFRILSRKYVEDKNTQK